MSPMNPDICFRWTARARSMPCVRCVSAGKICSPFIIRTPTVRLCRQRPILKRAVYPDALYLIISLDSKGVLEMRGWRLARRLEEVELLVG